MLALTKRSGYALIALAFLADPPGRIESAKTIAKNFGLPIRVLMNIMKQLSHAGLVNSSRGSRGGYSLADRPEDITLGQLIRTIEGPVGLTRCLHGSQSGGRCSILDRCPLRWPVERVQEKLDKFLDQTTLAQITEQIPEMSYTEAEHEGSELK